MGVFIMNANKVRAGFIETNFKVRKLSTTGKQEMIDKGVWKEGGLVSLERLSMVEFSYWYLEKHNDGWQFQGRQRGDGKIVVFDVVGQYVAEIFKELYAIKFPLHKACPMEDYNGNDDASMADNNSSCFNDREITGGGLPSLHAYGLAIDINTVQNPYIAFLEDKDIQGSGNTKVLPPSGRDYINRTNLRIGMIENTKEIVKIFKKHGFPIWGGKWNTPIDWQHFQVDRAIAQLLAIMSFDDGSILFEMYVADSNLVKSLDIKNNVIVDLYKENPHRFMSILSEGFLKMGAEEARVFFNE